MICESNAFKRFNYLFTHIGLEITVGHQTLTNSDEILSDGTFLLLSVMTDGEYRKNEIKSLK